MPLAAREVITRTARNTPVVKYAVPLAAAGATIFGLGKKSEDSRNAHFATIIRDDEFAVAMRFGRIRYQKWQDVDGNDYRFPVTHGPGVRFVPPFTHSLKIMSASGHPSELDPIRFTRHDKQYIVRAAIEWKYIKSLVDKAIIETTDVGQSVRNICQQELGNASEALTDETVAKGRKEITLALSEIMMEQCAEPLSEVGAKLNRFKLDDYTLSDVQIYAGSQAAANRSLPPRLADEMDIQNPFAQADYASGITNLD